MGEFCRAQVAQPELAASCDLGGRTQSSEIPELTQGCDVSAALERTSQVVYSCLWCCHDVVLFTDSCCVFRLSKVDVLSLSPQELVVPPLCWVTNHLALFKGLTADHGHCKLRSFPPLSPVGNCPTVDFAEVSPAANYRQKQLRKLFCIDILIATSSLRGVILFR